MESKLCFVVWRNFKQLFSNKSTEAQLKNFNSLFLFIVLFYLFPPYHLLLHCNNLKFCVCRFLCTNFYLRITARRIFLGELSPHLWLFLMDRLQHRTPLLISRLCPINEGEGQVITQARLECCFSRSGDNPSPTRAQREVNYMHALRVHLWSGVDEPRAIQSIFCSCLLALVWQDKTRQ